MRKLFLPLVITLISCSFSAQNLINFDQVLKDLQELSSAKYEGRAMGTEGAMMARDYIETRFNDLGLRPWDSSYIQPFGFMHPMKKRLQGYNVIGWIKGTQSPDEYVVVTSHFDHMGKKGEKIWYGADDNASGTCAVMGLAEYFSGNPPDRSVVFISFDGEENGLLGSKHFVQNLPMEHHQVVLNINLDMVSRSDKDEIWLCGLRYCQDLQDLVGNLSRFESLNVKVGHDSLDKLDDWTYSSDHGNFHRGGIPFIYVGVEDHEDYHKTTDTFEKVDKEFYKNVVDMVLEFCLLASEMNNQNHNENENQNE